MAGADLGRLVAQITLDNGQFKRSMSDTEAIMRRTGARIKEIGRDLTFALSAPLAIVGRDLINTFNSFERGLIGVAKTTGATEPEVAILRKEFQSLAKALPVPIEELLRIGVVAGQSGIELEKLAGFTETVARFSSASGVAFDEAARGLALFASRTGTQADKIENLASVLVTLGNTTIATEQDILHFTQPLTATGRIAGLAADQIAALGATLFVAGVGAEKGGTVIQKLLIRVQNALDAGGVDLKKFAQISGKTTDQFKEDWEKDAAGSLVKFLERINEAKNPLLVITSLFEDIRAAESISKLADSVVPLKINLESAAASFKAGTASIIESDAAFASLENSVQRASNTFDVLKTELVSAFEKPIREIVRGLADLLEVITPAVINFFKGLSDETKKYVIVLSALAIALPPLIFIFGSLYLVAGTIVPIFGAVAGSGVGLVAVLKLLAAKTAAVGGAVSSAVPHLELMKSTVAETAEGASGLALSFSEFGLSAGDAAKHIVLAREELDKFNEMNRDFERAAARKIKHVADEFLLLHAVIANIVGGRVLHWLENLANAVGQEGLGGAFGDLSKESRKLGETLENAHIDSRNRELGDASKRTRELAEATSLLSSLFEHMTYVYKDFTTAVFSLLELQSSAGKDITVGANQDKKDLFVPADLEDAVEKMVAGINSQIDDVNLDPITSAFYKAVAAVRSLDANMLENAGAVALAQALETLRVGYEKLRKVTLESALDKFTGGLKNQIAVLKEQDPVQKIVISQLQSLKDLYVGINGSVEGLADAYAKAMPFILEFAQAQVDAATAGKSSRGGLTLVFEKKVADIIAGINQQIQLIDSDPITVAMVQAIDSIREMDDKLLEMAGFKSVRDGIERVTLAYEGLRKATVVKTINDFNSSLQRQIDILSIHDPIQRSVQEMTWALSDAYEQAGGNMHLFTEELAKSLPLMRQLAVEQEAAANSVDFGEVFFGNFQTALEGFLHGTRNFDFFEILKDTAISTFADMFVGMLKEKLLFEIKLKNNFDGLGEFIRSFASSAGDILSQVFSFLLPAVFGGLGGVSTFSGSGTSVVNPGGGGIYVAHGGITTGPTQATIGDNPSGIEAVIPLERFNEIFGGSSGEVNIEIINNAGADVSVRQIIEDERGKTVQIAVNAALGEVSNQFSRGGRMVNAFRSGPLGRAR